MPTIDNMTTPKKRGRPRKGDRHKPGRQMRIRAVYLEQLDALAAQNGTSPPEEVNRFVREGLAREGRWPPPARP